MESETFHANNTSAPLTTRLKQQHVACLRGYKSVTGWGGAHQLLQSTHPLPPCTVDRLCQHGVTHARGAANQQMWNSTCHLGSTWKHLGSTWEGTWGTAANTGLNRYGLVCILALATTTATAQFPLAVIGPAVRCPACAGCVLCCQMLRPGSTWFQHLVGDIWSSFLSEDGSPKVHAQSLVHASLENRPERQPTRTTVPADHCFCQGQNVFHMQSQNTVIMHCMGVTSARVGLYLALNKNTAADQYQRQSRITCPYAAQQLRPCCPYSVLSCST
jgi:hypothetical protein